MTTIDIEQTRSNCFDRAIKLCEAYNSIDTALEALGWSATDIAEADDLARTNKMLPMHTSCITILIAHADRVSAEIYARLTQAAHLFARDVIAPMARESGDEAVVFITGNSFMPPIRSFDEVDELYQTECDVDPFVSFMEALENELVKLDVYMASPEYDNCLYVVDLRRFEYVGDDQGNDNINDDWKIIG